MSARCPEGHLSHNTDYCDRCGLPIELTPESYGRRVDEFPGRPVPQGAQSQPPQPSQHSQPSQPYAGDAYGRRGYGEPAPAPAPDPLGIRRVPADARGAVDTPRGYAPERPARPGGYSGYGHDGYAADPPTPAPSSADAYPEAYSDDPYGRAASSRGHGRDYPQDDPYGEGTLSRGRDTRGGYGGDSYGRDGYGHDGYGRAGREDEVDRQPHRPTEPYGYPAPPEPAVARPAPAPQAPGSAPEVGGRYAQCPNCHTLYESGIRFCESCGMDFATGHAPAQAGAAPFAPGPTTAHPDDRVAPYGDNAYGESTYGDNAYGDSRRAPSRPQGWETPGATAWEAVVEAERDYYDSGDDHRVPFPAFYPRRVFALDSPRLLVGRRSESRGIHPEIDLSGAPEDPGISRAHAMFEQMPDGTYAVLDPGSTNGTRLNDEPEPIEPGHPVPLRDGDRVYLGAWTRITLRAR